MSHSVISMDLIGGVMYQNGGPWVIFSSKSVETQFASFILVKLVKYQSTKHHHFSYPCFLSRLPTNAMLRKTEHIAIYLKNHYAI